MIARLAAASVAMLVAASALATDPRADAPDAPDARAARPAAAPSPPSYRDALARWRSVEDVNAWIGAHFAYDAARAAQLAEAQRERAPVPIRTPEALYATPSGVCVDLARFGVETLRALDPASKPVYLMIEFAPVEVAGAVLRRHWIAGFQRDGAHWFFADSKRPGHLDGPYATTAAFVDAYARYRQREVVAFRERDGFERARRAPAAKRDREAIGRGS
jgi:hypothetical protein